MRIKYLMGIISIMCIGILVTPALAKLQTSYAATLDYNKYASIYFTSIEKDGIIEWNFEGTNNYVGIEVWAMTDSEYYSWTAGGSATGYQESDGSYYIDSGTFDVPTADTWYIVFWNTDPDVESTYLTYEATYTAPSSGGAWGGLDVFWIIMIVAVIAVCCIVPVTASQKKRSHATVSKVDIDNKNVQQTVIIQQAPPPPQQYQQPPYQQPQYQQQPPYQQPAYQQPAYQQNERVNFCPNCGSKVDGRYCERCGSEIT